MRAMFAKGAGAFSSIDRGASNRDSLGVALAMLAARLAPLEWCWLEVEVLTLLEAEAALLDPLASSGLVVKPYEWLAPGR